MANRRSEDIDTFDPEFELRRRGIYYITGMIEAGGLVELHQDILLKHLDRTWNHPIQLIINSPGGDVSEGSMFIDLLDWVRMDIHTIGMGECQSLATCILAAGTKGKRSATKNCILMAHGAWVSGFIEGSRHEVAARTRWLDIEHAQAVDFWIRNSKYKTRAQVEKHFLGIDCFMSADEALEHGIIDHVIPAGTKVMPITERTPLQQSKVSSDATGSLRVQVKSTKKTA